MFSNILNLCSSLTVRDQFSYPHKATRKSTAFLIF
jgi:hypothetical protein